jgi:hypothetical protein
MTEPFSEIFFFGGHFVCSAVALSAWTLNATTPDIQKEELLLSSSTTTGCKRLSV